MTLVVDGLAEFKTLPGTALGPSDWMEITQEQVNAFADATHDHQWIHVDVEKAKAGPFGGPIAHGYLTVSLLIPLFGQLIAVKGVSMGVNYGLNKLRFPAPVPVGSRIRLAGTVAAVEEVTGGVQATFDFTVEVEGGAKPACVAQAIYRYYA
ncbi:MaoC family dehydratase [Nonomuraea soli]|uniref:Acyl dehydratase n=1 Tax=Nonomuraea soli TaxID=1032476 RepID=A0A7W0CHU8_9ACTN|nr:MaoC family dehydratase [Nonomuraea soli]MBA2891439.1 acyl dehydratase [Nonomuraea soli]NUT43784.1 MaoC family dehydratase [Thermoactinospora sp.]